ncbi:MAG TPA: hypothetical protein VIF15_09520 [Polyangiaceae bacterium]
MERDPSTPLRRLGHCRIMQRPWGMPTLIAYPPPPYASTRPRPFVSITRAPEPPAPSPWPTVRSRSYRRRHDCVFIPDMEVAVEFLEARRLAAQIERGERRKGRPEREERQEQEEEEESATLDDPLALGLLMTFLPPLAVTLVWSSRRFCRAAQIALTLYGAMMTLVFAAIVISALT